MSLNTQLNLGVGGDTMVTIDLANFATFGYTSGATTPPAGSLIKLPAVVLYASQVIGTVPTPVLAANPLPVGINGAIPAGTNVIGTVLLGAGTAAVGTVTTNADCTVAAGAAPSKVLGVAGVYNTTNPNIGSGQSAALQLDPAGNLRVTAAGLMPSFGVSSGSFVPVGSATDIAIINGSANRTVKVLKVKVQLNTTGTATTPPVSLIKRSTANSGGSATQPTPVPFDTNNPNAVTAVVNVYTANPTTGNTVGTADSYLLQTSTATSGGAANEWVADFSANPIVLRGVAQGLAVNLNGNTVAATAAAKVSYEWTEE